MKKSDVVIPEETTEVKLAMRIAELESENKYLKLEAKEDEELIDGLEAERDRLQRIADNNAAACVELEQNCNRLREALRMVGDCIPRIIEDEMDRVISPEAMDAVLKALEES